MKTPSGVAGGLMVKANENPGFGPPPGSGFVTTTFTGPAIVRRAAGIGMSKTVPPDEAVPPVSGKLLKVTCVLFTNCDPPVKCRVTGVFTVVLLGDMLPALRSTGFIIVNGAPPFPLPRITPGSTPAGSVNSIGNTPPVVRSVLGSVTFNCVVFTNVGVPTEPPLKKTAVFALKLKPLIITGVAGSPTNAAAGVTDVMVARGPGLTSVS